MKIVRSYFLTKNTYQEESLQTDSTVRIQRRKKNIAINLQDSNKSSLIQGQMQDGRGILNSMRNKV